MEAVGPDVDKSWIGKQVSTIPAFSLNEYSMVGETALAPVKAPGEYPPNLSPAEGAAVWMQYVTAYGALRAIANVKKGDFVVIPAASSSIGLAAIEIVKAGGGISIATTRKGSKREELKKLGADHVIATDEEDYVSRVAEITGRKGARVTFHPVAGAFMEKLTEAAQRGGYFCVWRPFRAINSVSFAFGPEQRIVPSGLHIDGNHTRAGNAGDCKKIYL